MTKPKLLLTLTFQNMMMMSLKFLISNQCEINKKKNLLSVHHEIAQMRLKGIMDTLLWI